MKLKMFCSVVVVVASLFFIACADTASNGTDEKEPPVLSKASSILTPYSSCDELMEDVKKALVSRSDKMIEEQNDCMMVTPVTIGDSSSIEYTPTNTQEVNVDEDDLIKTNGKHVFAIVNNTVQIAVAWPAKSFKIISTIIPQESPVGLYLANNDLVIIEQSNAVNGWCDPFSDTKGTPKVFEEIYDISTPGSPKRKTARSVDGCFLGSRRIDSNVYIIVNKFMKTPSLKYYIDIRWNELCDKDFNPTAKMKEEIEKLKKTNREAINGLTLTSLFPENTPTACEDISRVKDTTGFGILSIFTSDLNKPNEKLSSESILAAGGTVYASKNSIYIAHTGDPYSETQNTFIHMFRLNNGKPTYNSSNTIEGYLVDNHYVGSINSSRFSMAQFAMSEYQDHLRIASTKGHVSPDGSSAVESMVNIFNSGMDLVGFVDGLGKGERIYAVRFIEDRGYVVTYKKVDPLFVLNLEKPASPEVLGELKIPGFSTYLHPLNENLIIGLGYGGDDMGGFAWTQGLKLALFDVSDPSNPREVGSRELGTRGSYSPAVEEHHAFTLDKERNMLALPADLTEDGDGSNLGTASFSGILVINVDESGKFETIDEIEVNEVAGSGSYSSYWSANVLRTIIIGDDNETAVIGLTSTKLDIFPVSN